MKFRENQWLDDQIKSWARDGLISPSQVDAILAKRQADAKTNILNATNLLAALGGLCVLLGVILVISYNWDKIPHFLKIGVYLLLLVGMGEATLHVPEKYKVGRTALQVGWLLMPLAGIGLWAQIYQLSGDPLKPILIWLALGLPLVWKGKDDAVAFLHTAGIAWAAYTGAFSQDTWLTIVQPGWNYQSWDGPWRDFLVGYSLPMLGVGLLWALGFLQVKRFLQDKGRWLFTVAFLLFLNTLQWTHSPFYCDGGAGGFLHVSALVILYWGLSEAFRVEAGFWRAWGWYALASVLYGMTFLWHESSLGGWSAPIAILTLVELIVGTLLLVRPDDGGLGSDKAGVWSFRSLLFAPAILSYLLVLETPPKAVAIMANLAFLGLAVWLVREGMVSNRPKRINGGVALVGILVFTRFIDYFGTLLQSGFAFIVIGLVFVALAFGLNRGRQELIARVQGGKP